MRQQPVGLLLKRLDELHRLRNVISWGYVADEEIAIEKELAIRGVGGAENDLFMPHSTDVMERPHRCSCGRWTDQPERCTFCEG